jgi:hypothetical protein
MAQVCAWWDDSIFSLDDKRTTEDVKFLSRWTALADSRFGSGRLTMTPTARNVFGDDRIADGPDNKGDVFFASVRALVSGKSTSLTQLENDIFLTVYIDQGKGEGLITADSEHEDHSEGRPLRGSRGRWYEYVILQFR